MRFAFMVQCSLLACVILLASRMQGYAQEPQLLLRTPQENAHFLARDSSGREAITLLDNTFYRWDIRTGNCLQQRAVGEEVDKVRSSPSRRWLLVASKRAGRSFLTLYHSGTLEVVARLNIDSVHKAQPSSAYFSLHDVCLNEASGWIGVAGTYELLLYNYRRNTVVLKRLGQQCSTIACIGDQWLLGMSTENGQAGLALADTIASTAVHPMPGIPTSEYIQMLVPSADRSYALAVLPGDAFVIKPDATPVACESPTKPHPFTGAYNFWWDGPALFITSADQTWTFDPARNAFSQIIVRGSSRYLYSTRFAMPLGEHVFLTTGGVSVQDYFVTEPTDTTLTLEQTAPFGNGRLAAPWSIEPAGPSRYLVEDGIGYYFIDLNNLEAVSLHREMPEGWLTGKQLSLPHGFAQVVTHGNGRFDTSYRQQVGIAEYDSVGTLDTAYDVATTSIWTFTYLGNGGKTIFLFDPGRHCFYKVDRATKKVRRLRLPGDDNPGPPKERSLFASLAGDDFLFAGRALMRYDAAKAVFRTIDEADKYHQTDILTPRPQRGFVFYLGPEPASKSSEPILKRYDPTTGAVDSILGDFWKLTDITAGTYKGEECWYVALRDRGWELRVYSNDFSRQIASLPVNGNVAIKSLHYDEQKQLLLVLQGDALQVFDARRAAEAARLLFSRENIMGAPLQVLAVAPNNRYFVPSREVESLNWSLDGSSYIFSAFDRYYNDPVFLLETLRSSDSTLVAAHRKAAAARRKRLGKEQLAADRLLIPLARFADSEIPYYTDSATLALPVYIKAVRKKVVRVRLWVNNVPEPRDSVLAVPVELGREQRIVLHTQLEHNQRSILRVQAIDEEGNASLATEIPVYHRKQATYVSRRTWYLGIGIAHYRDSRYNLKFAAKDVTDIASRFKKSEGIPMGGSRVLTDSLVTATNLDEALRWLAGNVALNDIVIVSFSGHGLSQSGQFYLTLHGTDFSNVPASSYSFDRLSNALRAIPCRKKLLLIDACASGDRDDAGDVVRPQPAATVVMGAKGILPGSANAPAEVAYLNLMKAYFADMGDESGATIIAATSGSSVAYEDAQYQNGAFTYAFIKGFFELDAIPQRGIALTLSRLADYLSREVKRITGGRQQPSIRSIDLRHDWQLETPDR